jgi:hypothetical protein
VTFQTLVVIAVLSASPLDSQTTAKLLKQAAQLLNEVEKLREAD